MDTNKAKESFPSNSNLAGYKNQADDAFTGQDLTTSSFAADEQEKTRVTKDTKVIQPPKHADL